MPPPRPDAERGLPRAARLRTRRDFDRVIQRGRKVVERRLVVWILPAPPGTPSRIGLMVSRKVGDSPRRNRVKRVLRAAFRHAVGAWSEPLELVILARPGAAPADLDEARRSLDKIVDLFARGPARGSRR